MYIAGRGMYIAGLEMYISGFAMENDTRGILINIQCSRVHYLIYTAFRPYSLCRKLFLTECKYFRQKYHHFGSKSPPKVKKVGVNVQFL